MSLPDTMMAVVVHGKGGYFFFYVFLSSFIPLQYKYTQWWLSSSMEKVQFRLPLKAMIWYSGDQNYHELSWIIIDYHRPSWTIVIIRGLPHGGSACPKTGTTGSSGQGDCFKTCNIFLTQFKFLSDILVLSLILVKLAFDFAKLRWRQWVSVPAMPKHSLGLKDFGVSCSKISRLP